MRGKVADTDDVRTQVHVIIFAAHNGPGPYVCSDCGRQVDLLEPYGSEMLTIHHLDGDHSNNDPANLAAAHKGCHTRIHHRGREKSITERAALRASMTPEVRERMSKALRGKKRPPEVLAKIAATWATKNSRRGLASSADAEAERRQKIAAGNRKKEV